MPYPTLTKNLHYEVELVVAIHKGGKNITANHEEHIFGYAVGLDMTRRDLQAECKKLQRPWSIGKGFDFSSPLGPITPRNEAKGIEQAEISLSVNGDLKQKSSIDKLINTIPQLIEHIS